MTHDELMEIADAELEGIKELLYEAHLNNDKSEYIEQIDERVQHTGQRMLDVLNGLEADLLAEENDTAAVRQFLAPLRTLFSAAMDGLDGVRQYQSLQGNPESLWGDPPPNWPGR